MDQIDCKKIIFYRFGVENTNWDLRRKKCKLYCTSVLLTDFNEQSRKSWKYKCLNSSNHPYTTIVRSGKYNREGGEHVLSHIKNRPNKTFREFVAVRRRHSRDVKNERDSFPPIAVWHEKTSPPFPDMFYFRCGSRCIYTVQRKKKLSLRYLT